MVMVALAENDCIPGLNNLLVEQAGWLYFSPWYGDYIFNEDMNSKIDLEEIYTSDYCITLDELPDLRQQLENTHCTQVKRIYNEETCTNAPTSNSHLKCVLKIDGDNKSCVEEKKGCLEIINDANEEICNNAPVSDSDKKCILNTEKTNECREINKEEDETQAVSTLEVSEEEEEETQVVSTLEIREEKEETQTTSQKSSQTEKETKSTTQIEESKNTVKIMVTEQNIENNEKISNELSNSKDSDVVISTLEIQNIDNKTGKNGNESNISNYIKYSFYLICILFLQ